MDEAVDRPMTSRGPAAAATTVLSFHGHGANGFDVSAPSLAAVQANGKKKARRGTDSTAQKRRCVSTACIACRKRKSKCDGAVPKCAACSSVYGTDCLYDPGSDHRRKGVYREKIDSVKARTSTLQILIEAILNGDDDEAADVVKRIRACEDLEKLAQQLAKQQKDGRGEFEDYNNAGEDDLASIVTDAEGERELARKMGELRVENDSVSFIGGTSHLIYLGDPTNGNSNEPMAESLANEDPLASWTTVTQDTKVILHLVNMYFTYHYTFFATLSKPLFYRDFTAGKAALSRTGPTYCSSLLVNAILALGCHFTNIPGAYATQGDSRTKGDHFFAEAKLIITVNDEYERPRLTTVQALALMSVREAGCGRETKGWVYSGMSFRMAQDIGLNLDITSGAHGTRLSDEEIDARRMSFWGCFVFDKAWSNYLGRLPQIPQNSHSVPKYDVFPDEDADAWTPYRDDGFDEKWRQPSRTRAVGRQLLILNEISSDLLIFFYHPHHIYHPRGKAVELKKLSELHRRLEEWRQTLPKELEPKDGQLPNVILMHMFFHLQYIHLFRPFLKYTPSTSPLPPHISPRRICTSNAGAISKLLRLYKRTWGLRQICNIVVYMVHSACTIHLLNLPDRTARRDITHGVRALEEVAEDWLCARRTLAILSVLAKKWNCELPDEAVAVLNRTDEKYGTFSLSVVPSPMSQASGPRPSVSPTVSHAMVNFASLQNPQPEEPERGSMCIPADTAMPAEPATMTTTTGVGSDTRLHTQSPIPMAAPTTSGMESSTSPWASPANMPLSMGYPNMVSSYRPVQRTSTPVSTQNINRPFSSSHSGPRMPTSVDGQTWFIHDSIKWQQNFAPWSNNSPAPAQNTSQGPPDGHQVQLQTQLMPVDAQEPGAPSDDQIFLFREGLGRPMSDQGSGMGMDGDGGGPTGYPASFDSLAMGSMEWGSLAGLE